jgi:cbb3-type cytochrome oxidase subunit 3
MWLIFVEALAALLLLILIVWWTMFSGRKKGELPQATASSAQQDKPDAPN